MTLALALASCLAARDPAPGLLRSKASARNLDCERWEALAANERYPGIIEEPNPRVELIERSLVVCRERLTRPGLRTPREEAILAGLEATTGALAEHAASIRPDLAERTWLVEAFDPSVAVAGKIAFATKNALMRHGLRVSDRTPILSAGDVDVVTRMPPEQAYPTACRRWADTGALDADEVLIAIVVLDPRETVLHAGLCERGGWAWLR